jgi:hypothetical protein
VRPDRVDTGQRFAARLASGLATRSGRRYRLSMQSLSSRGLMVSSRCRMDAASNLDERRGLTPVDRQGVPLPCMR